jgi:hypothetical protein
MARGKGTPGTPAGYGPQPVKAAPSAQYGQAAASTAAQSAVPLPDMTQAPTLAPGEVPLDLPSARPNEPITEGASFGPGRNLDQLQMPVQRQQPDVDPELFAVFLPQLEAVASQPNSSHAMRSFVRRLRAQLPIGFDPTAGR